MMDEEWDWDATIDDLRRRCRALGISEQNLDEIHTLAADPEAEWIDLYLLLHQRRVTP